MAEYIEREALYKEVTERYCDITAGAYPFNIVAYDMAKLVKNAPAADVVEVVRCGQCRHATDDIIVEGVCYCHKIQQGMFLDGFCSYGERRKE